MATDNNNKVLNVPNKREQSGIYSGYAERGVLRPQGNVPNLRFPEFTEDWVQYKCSDLLEFYSTNSLSWEQLDYESEELLNLHYGLIHVGLPTLVNVAQNNLPAIKSEFVPKNYTLCNNGDVAFADASEDTNEVAKPIEFFDCSDRQVVCGLHTIHGRDKLGITEVGFKGYAFSSTPFHHKIRRLAQGSKVFSISAKNFSEVSIGVPSKKEQQKIIGLLSKLDERIDTQNKIIEDLKKLKVAIRDKELNVIRKRHGLNRQILELLDYEQPSRYIVSNTEYSDDSNLIPVLTANKAFILGYTDEPFGIYDKGLCIILDDFTLDCKLVNFAFKIKSSAIKILTSKNGISLRYVYEYLNHIGLETTEHKRHYISAIEPMLIAYPDNNEVVISFCDLMDKFDQKIEIENKYLQSLLAQKAYLLINMFI